MNKVTLLGIDIAKDVFQLHGVDEGGRVVVKKRLKRGQLLRYIVEHFEACTIAMEACGGAHHWAREFIKLGYEVKLISPQFVKPFVKTNKNDAHDAQAITIAARQPDMRFVPIKGMEQQDVQSVHRIRTRLMENRTALVNQARGLLAEYGIVAPRGIAHLRKLLPDVMEDAENGLSFKMRELCSDFYEELKELDERIEAYNAKITEIFEANPICKQLAKIEGVGEKTATVLMIHLSDPSLFKNGRHFAAFLGLVPRQHSSGGRERLLGISKRGDSYLRSLLVHGGRSVVRTAGKKRDKRSCWVKQVHERRGYNRTSVAVANKNARIAWSIVANETKYKKAV